MITEDQSSTQLSDFVVGEYRLLRTLIDNLPDGIYIKNTESQFVMGNMAVAHLMGVQTPDELIGKTDFDFFPSEFASKYRTDEQAVMRSNQPLVNQEELTFDFRTGQQGWLLTSKVVWRDESGKVVGIIGIGRDITELKQAQNALEEALDELENRVQDRTLELTHTNAKLARVLEFYRSTLDHIKTAIQETGMKTEILMVVEQAQKQFDRMS